MLLGIVLHWSLPYFSRMGGFESVWPADAAEREEDQSFVLAHKWALQYGGLARRVFHRLLSLLDGVETRTPFKKSVRFSLRDDWLGCRLRTRNIGQSEET